jgi:hypothetical protein
MTILQYKDRKIHRIGDIDLSRIGK